jgi:hypothetical protein
MTMLTERDMKMFETLLEVQFLTVHQIAQLFFPSIFACRNRLLALKKDGWLEEERPRSNYLPSLVIVKLGKKALKFLGHVSTKTVACVYLEHRLELNDLYVNLKSGGVLSDLNLDWQDGSNFTIPYQDTHFRPDARLIGSSSTMIYLEYDRGTKNLPIVQENLSKYLAWLETKEFQSGYYSKIQLIYVTPKESRAKAIQKEFEKACQDQIQSTNFRFDSLTTEGFLKQSKSILGEQHGLESNVTDRYGQTNQKTF